jgi:hypothetical protein
MTDLIDRVGDLPVAGPLPGPEPWKNPEPGSHLPATRNGRPGCVFLAVVLGCSAILLFLAASQHIAGDRALGVALVLAGWAQVAFGVGVLVRSSRSLFRWIATLNLGIAALWLVVLVGHHGTGHFTAGVGTALSGLAVIVSAALVVRPSVGLTWQSSTSVLLSLVPVAVVVVTTVALTTPAPTPASVVTGTAAGGAPLNPFSSSVPVPGQNSSRFLQIASGNDTEKSELKPYVPLDPATQAALDQQLAIAAQAAMRFPTVADAKAAGMVLAGGMAPGVGAHYQVLNASSLTGINADGSVNPARPASWIYASTADAAPVVGIMYESLADTAPSGFAGPNDHWHQHSNLCITFRNGAIGVPFAPDSSVTPQQCANVHGQFMKKTVWMVHAWVVPGWESPQGVFSHANSHIYCPGNTDLTDAIGFCLRQA